MSFKQDLKINLKVMEEYEEKNFSIRLTTSSEPRKKLFDYGDFDIYMHLVTQEETINSKVFEQIENIYDFLNERKQKGRKKDRLYKINIKTPEPDSISLYIRRVKSKENMPINFLIDLVERLLDYLDFDLKVNETSEDYSSNYIEQDSGNVNIFGSSKHEEKEEDNDIYNYTGHVEHRLPIEDDEEENQERSDQNIFNNEENSRENEDYNIFNQDNEDEFDFYKDNNDNDDKEEENNIFNQNDNENIEEREDNYKDYEKEKDDENDFYKEKEEQNQTFFEENKDEEEVFWNKENNKERQEQIEPENFFDDGEDEDEQFANSFTQTKKVEEIHAEIPESKIKEDLEEIAHRINVDINEDATIFENQKIEIPLEDPDAIDSDFNSFNDKKSSDPDSFESVFGDNEEDDEDEFWKSAK